jgi:hypothetical protein
VLARSTVRDDLGTQPDGAAGAAKQERHADRRVRLATASGQAPPRATPLVRLRPIVMTRMCFIPMAPPYFPSGAGAEMRCSVRTVVRWGAFSVWLFGIFLTPALVTPPELCRRGPRAGHRRGGRVVPGIRGGDAFSPGGRKQGMRDRRGPEMGEVSLANLPPGKR